MFGMTPFGMLFAAWAAVTAALVLAMIYRAVVGFGEEDQIFLDPAEAQLELHQQAVLSRLDHIGKYTRAFGAASGALLVAMLCWIGVDVARQLA